MKWLIRAAAVLVSAAIMISGMTFSAYAEPAVTTPPAASDQPAVSTDPALTGGAVCAAINTSASTITKNKKFDLMVSTLIPVVNYSDTLRVYDLPVDEIALTALNNESFTFSNVSATSYRYWFVGAFLCVGVTFSDVTYLGKGNTFNYLISYTGEKNAAMSASLSGLVAGCEEYVEKQPEEEKKVETPSFVLQSAKSYSVKAGDKTTLKFSFSSIGSGKFSRVGASLSSSTSSIIVDNIGEKLSTSSTPSFDFPVTISETASAGVYNLTLKVQVYDVNGNSAASSSYDIPVSVTSNIVKAGLSVESYDVSKNDIKSGDKFTLSLKLKNNCGIDLDGVSVSLDVGDAAKFALDGGFSKQSVNIKKGKTADVEFVLVAGDGIKSTRETIGVKAAYLIDPSNADTQQSLDTSVIISCKPKDSTEENNKFALSMTNYKVSEVDVKDGTHFRLDITLTNSSKKKISNARVSLTGLDGVKFAADSGLMYADFDIDAGARKSFSFNLVGCAGIASIREVVPVHIEFGEIVSDSYATISCKPKKNKEDEKDENEVFAPNIIIESYDFGGTFVTAGQTFPLSVTIKNVSGISVIENLKVTLNGASNSANGSIAYSPANASNSFFFETLGMKSSEKIDIDLLAKSDATPNSYPVQISFEYEYSYNGKHYKANGHNEMISIPLQQEDRLTFSDPESPGYSINVGDICTISVSIVNKGKSSAYNVSAAVEGEGFTAENPTYYIGNVDSGKEEYYDAQIIPQQEGDIRGTIIFTYEDSNGDAKEQRKTFSFSAATFNYGGMMGMDGDFFDDGMMVDEQQDGDMTWLFFVIGGVVLVIVGIIVTVVIVKKSKARKLQKELEEDDEDN